MKTIKFKHCNTVIAKNQEEYKTLHALKLDGDTGEIVTCWKLSLWERLRVLFTGILWRSDMTFNKPFTPTFMSTKRTDVYTHLDDLTEEEFWDYKIKKVSTCPTEELNTCMIDTTSYLNPYYEMRSQEYNSIIQERLKGNIESYYHQF